MVALFILHIISGFCGEVLGHLAGQDADFQPRRGTGDHRDHLWNVDDTATGHAVVDLNQAAPREDILHAPGEPLLVYVVRAFTQPGVVPRKRVQQRWEGVFRGDFEGALCGVGCGHDRLSLFW
jgi:hypothetical protein